MKPGQALIALMLCMSFSVFGLQSKNTTSQNQPKQPTVEQLQQENDSIKRLLSELKGKFELYHNDVLSKESQINDNLVIWFGFFTIIMAILGVVFPLIFNRRAEAQAEEAKNQATEARKLVESAKGQVEQAQTQVSTAQTQAAEAKKLVEQAQTQAKEAKTHAETAKYQVGLIESKVNEAVNQAALAAQALKEIEALKDQIKGIKSDVDLSKDEAIQAALSAKASEYFSQAASEKDPVKAIELYTKCIDIKPDYTEAYNNRGILKMISGNRGGAEQDYDRAIEIDNNNAFAYYNRGYLNDKSGKKDRAKEDYDKAIELNPDYAEALNNRSYLLLSMGLKEAAMNDANRAIELDSTNFEHYDTRGEIYMVMEKYHEAINDFTDAVKYNPSCKKVYEKRAACYNKLARLEKDEEKKAEYVKKAQDDIRKSINLEQIESIS